MNSISGGEYLQLLQPIVYVWRRGDEVLYVGASKNGFQRLFNHNVIGFRERMLESDRIDFWQLESWPAALSTEKQLIQDLQPRLNNAGTLRDVKLKANKRTPKNYG